MRKITSLMIVAMMVTGSFAGLMSLSSDTADAAGLADTPWPMFRGNARHTGQSHYDTGGNSGTLKWKYHTGNVVYSSSAIGSDGTIYVGSLDNYIYALNPNGTLRWKYQTGDEVHSSPAIGSDGTIYVGSLDNYIYALNPDGTLKWKYQTGGYLFSSPVIGSDGTIYVGSDDGYLYALGGGGSSSSSSSSDTVPTAPQNLTTTAILLFILALIGGGTVIYLVLRRRKKPSSGMGTADESLSESPQLRVPPAQDYQPQQPPAPPIQTPPDIYNSGDEKGRS